MGLFNIKPSELAVPWYVVILLQYGIFEITMYIGVDPEDTEEDIIHGIIQEAKNTVGISFGDNQYVGCFISQTPISTNIDGTTEYVFDGIQHSIRLI